MKTETCDLNCDEMHCEVCEAQQEPFTLTELERANIEYAFARASVDMKKKLMLEIEELQGRARIALCGALARLNQVEKKLKELENEKIRTD